MKPVGQAAFAIAMLFSAPIAFGQSGNVPLPPVRPLDIGKDIDAQALMGAVASALSDDDRVYLTRYTAEKSHLSAKYDRELVVGHALPSDIPYYIIRERPTMVRFRYAIVNDRTVIVDGQTTKIIEIIR